MQKQNVGWDDVRFFLAVSRLGSARAVAEDFMMSHSTVSRRIENLEGSLGTRLFNRNVTGYQLTEDGRALLHYAEDAESAMREAEQVLMGRDTKLTGYIHMTTPDVISKCFLFPELSNFSNQYPDIDIEISTTSGQLDLSRFEADIAIRLIQAGGEVPDSLVGRKLGSIASCCYASKDYLQQHDLQDPNTKARWIGWGGKERFPTWVKRTPYPHIPTVHYINQGLLQFEFVKSGMGMAMLPCFIAENEQKLQRVPGCEPQVMHEAWLLSHPDYREVTRLRMFKEFLVDLFHQKKGILLDYV
ncbi:LysR family transcriptional regulator [uncultured Shewanella sp.]|uniref:LysR family transcriptional regulator n=1 Tax=uncultured Shewanella sp. TaxID=173975 RepID=UPI00260770E7|nr:LysR family transcriptional regulator [uncultured Shewanella sp.]